MQFARVCYRDTCGKWGGTPSLLPHIQKEPPKLEILCNVSEDQQNLLKCGSPNSRFYATKSEQIIHFSNDSLNKDSETRDFVHFV